MTSKSTDQTSSLEDSNSPQRQDFVLKAPNQKSKSESDAKWINNSGAEVEQVFGFNENAELVNGRAAMIGFLMLILTELVIKGKPVTESIFGITN